MSCSPRPTKRRRMSGTISPITPLSPYDEGTTTEVQSTKALDDRRTLTKAVNVLRIEAEALANIADLYETNPIARSGLSTAVAAILTANANGGKLIATAVGKSAYIAQKLIATCKSLSIPSSFMHACEAAHGDLGDIRPNDVLIFVSFSGKTPELLNLLPHIPMGVRLVCLTSHLSREGCQILAGRDDGVLLPAPIPETEEASFGVSAPTTSTTVALAVADMLALTVAEELHRGKSKGVFSRNHPGGAIGMTHREVEALKRKGEVDVSVVELPSPSVSAESEG